MKQTLIVILTLISVGFASCKKDHSMEEFMLKYPNMSEVVNSQITVPHKVISVGYQKLEEDRFSVGVGYETNDGDWKVYYGVFNYRGKLIYFEHGK